MYTLFYIGFCTRIIIFHLPVAALSTLEWQLFWTLYVHILHTDLSFSQHLTLRKTHQECGTSSGVSISPLNLSVEDDDAEPSASNVQKSLKEGENETSTKRKRSSSQVNGRNVKRKVDKGEESSEELPEVRFHNLLITSSYSGLHQEDS